MMRSLTSRIATAFLLAATLLLAGCTSATGMLETAAQDAQVAPSAQAKPSTGTSSAGTSSTSAPSAGTSSADALTQDVWLTAEEATAIALEHAGFAETEVTLTQVHSERDDRRQIYEVEFFVDMTEYDYDIDATTGEIVGWDIDSARHK